MILSLIFNVTLSTTPARAFLLDAGPLRDRPLVNRCVAALIGPGLGDVDPATVQAKIRKFFLGPIPLEVVTGREVIEGRLSEAAGLHEILPRRWYASLNPFSAAMRDQRLLRLAVDLADERIAETVRVYRGPGEIDAFLTAQTELAGVLDERIRPFLTPNWRVKKTVVSALRLATFGAVGAWLAFPGAWPVSGAIVGAAGAFDAARLLHHARYAVAKLIGPRGREPRDPRAHRLEKGLRALAGAKARRYFGITSYVPHELAPVLAGARSVDALSAEDLEQLAYVRRYPPRASTVLDDYALKVSADYLYQPGATPAESELVVITRVGLPRSR